MKRRLVAMFTAVTLVLSMAGCGGTRPAEEKKDTNTAAVAADDTGGSTKEASKDSQRKCQRGKEDGYRPAQCPWGRGKPTTWHAGHRKQLLTNRGRAGHHRTGHGRDGFR